MAGRAHKIETRIEPFHQQLRSHTRTCHERVDAAFSMFDLSDPGSYADFLRAHATALLPLEAWMRADELIAGWHGRSDALRTDLAEIGVEAPPPLRLNMPSDEATRWGALYVLEGSRLGGRVLGSRVGEGLPRAYLGAPFSSAAWRDLLSALDRCGAHEDAGWRNTALAGANATFALFERAVGHA